MRCVRRASFRAKTQPNVDSSITVVIAIAFRARILQRFALFGFFFFFQFVIIARDGRPVDVAAHVVASPRTFVTTDVLSTARIIIIRIATRMEPARKICIAALQ